MVELYTGRPLFPGDSEIDQIFRIFQRLGTPNERIWPGVSALPDFQPSFPQWPAFPNAIEQLVPNADHDTLDLMQRMLCYDPAARISAKDALQHPYFDGLKTLEDGEAQVLARLQRAKAARTWQERREKSLDDVDVGASPSAPIELSASSLFSAAPAPPT